MRVAIAGAGAVGRSIAAELLDNGHEVLLIDKNPRSITVDSVPRAEWLLADACEITSLDEASLERCNVVIAATGDDKANLVVSLLAKTEYGVPRVVARINHPNNEWLFNESWGVDVAVSTPRLLSALVEEAVSVGDLVRLMTFRQSEASLVELTMPDDAPLAGQRIGDIALARRHRAGRDPAGRPGDRPGRGRPAGDRRRAAVRDQRGRGGRTGQPAGRRPPGRRLTRRLPRLGDLRAALERVERVAEALSSSAAAICSSMACRASSGSVDLQQVAGRHRVVAADHHHVGEDLLERPGRRGAAPRPAR